MNYLIIGNSAAGLNGAQAVRSRDANGTVTIVSEEDYPAYSRCLIPYFMEGKITEADVQKAQGEKGRRGGMQTWYMYADRACERHCVPPHLRGKKSLLQEQQEKAAALARA